MHFALEDDAGRISGYSGPGGHAALVFSTRELAEAEKYGSLKVIELTAANVNEFVSRCKQFKLAAVLIDADDVVRRQIRPPRHFPGAATLERRHQIQEYVNYYNTIRRHSSLDYQSPTSFERNLQN